MLAVFPCGSHLNEGLKTDLVFSRDLSPDSRWVLDKEFPLLVRG